MKMTFLAFKTDEKHSQEVRDLIGICEDLSQAIRICLLKAKEENTIIGINDMYNLSSIFQTQNYDGEGEFIIEQKPLNTILN